MTATSETQIRELKEFINSRFEQLDKKIEALDKKVEIGFAEVKGEIKRLDERIDSIDKRLERVETSQKNQIWALIGILGTTLLGLTSKVLFFSSNP